MNKNNICIDSKVIVENRSKFLLEKCVLQLKTRDLNLRDEMGLGLWNANSFNGILTND